MATRTKKRSRSGAHTTCPHCGKKLRGAKGLAAHLATAHGVAAAKAMAATKGG